MITALCPRHSDEWQRWLDYQVSPRLRLEASAAYDFTPQGVADKHCGRVDDWAATIRFQQALIVKACAEQCGTRYAHETRSGSLFTGVLGLDLAVAEAFGTELAWACDNDSAAAKVIEHRAGVPNLGDITAVDWTTVEPVEVLTAGWPCQPWSTAGKRRGVEDERALWPEIARALRALRPRIVALENVPRIVTAGELGRVADTLAALGYRFGWTVLGADEVGASHRRNRCFILAVADSAGSRRSRHVAGASVSRDGVAASLAGEVQLGGLDRAAADTDSAGLEGREPAARHNLSAGCTSADANGGGRGRFENRKQPGRVAAERNSAGGVDWGVYGPAIRRWERIIGRAAPVPRVAGPRGGMKLNPALPEFMMGFPAGWITDVPGVSMNDALRLAGNAVCPPQAVAAFRWLLDQLDGERAA